MDMLNIPQDNNDYAGLSKNSTDDERINVVLQILSKETSPTFLSYHRLFVEHGKENLFDARLKKTEFVETIKAPNDYHPQFKLNDDGHLMLAEHHSFLNHPSRV